MEAFNALMDNHIMEIEFSCLVKGIQQAHESDDEGVEPDESLYTQAQMDSLRYIMITKEREAPVENLRRLVLEEQADDKLLMFNTS